MRSCAGAQGMYPISPLPLLPENQGYVSRSTQALFVVADLCLPPSTPVGRSFVLVCPTQMKISIAWGWSSTFWRKSTLKCLLCSCWSEWALEESACLCLASNIKVKQLGCDWRKCPRRALIEHWCHVLLKISIMLPHLQQGLHKAKGKSLLKPRVSLNPKISGRHVCSPGNKRHWLCLWHSSVTYPWNV